MPLCFALWSFFPWVGPVPRYVWQLWLQPHTITTLGAAEKIVHLWLRVPSSSPEIHSVWTSLGHLSTSEPTNAGRSVQESTSLIFSLTLSTYYVLDTTAHSGNIVGTNQTVTLLGLAY